MLHHRIIPAFLLLALAAFMSFAQSAPKTKNLRLEVSLTGCQGVSEVLYLYEFSGIGFKMVNGVQIQDNKAAFDLPMSGPRFYYVGTNENNLKPLVLGTEAEVKMSSDCKQMRNAQFVNSPLNLEYEQLREQVNKLRSAANQLSNQYRLVAADPVKADAMAELMKKNDEEKLRLLDSLKKANPYFEQVAALNTYLSYVNYGSGYENELIYFVKEYFKYADWENRDLDYLPWVYESWKSFAETISNTGIQKDKHKEFIDEALKAVPADTRTYQLALGGVVATLQTKNHPNFIPYAKEYLRRYEAADPQVVAPLKTALVRMEASADGGTAPDFKQATPDGKQFGLSDLRGKVVLIDFWASWCGPCRRENPNVVKLYNRFKDKGFDILGVSLDTDRARWLGAIEADGLVWPQVSDLKGWQNEVGQLYGVRSIPHTVLVDREGKIIAKNLRGAALEAKVAEIFGE